MRGTVAFLDRAAELVADRAAVRGGERVVHPYVAQVAIDEGLSDR
ncbi:hypothetical protein [Actinoplanes sp. NPDC049118]